MREVSVEMTLPMDKLCLGLINPHDDPRSSEIKKTYVISYRQEASALPHTCTCDVSGLIPAEHRLAMCNLACRSSEFVMVDPWESTYQRTLTVLSRVKTALCESHLVFSGTLKVMIICGSDLVESFCTPGVWIRDQVRAISRDSGLVCSRRNGQDVEKIINDDDILNNFKNNIKIVDEVVPNGISSTGLRDCISRGLSVKYLTADEVIDYIKQHDLYIMQAAEV